VSVRVDIQAGPQEALSLAMERNQVRRTKVPESCSCNPPTHLETTLPLDKAFPLPSNHLLVLVPLVDAPHLRVPQASSPHVSSWAFVGCIHPHPKTMTPRGRDCFPVPPSS
jgi:hypothetical protein